MNTYQDSYSGVANGQRLYGTAPAYTCTTGQTYANLPNKTALAAVVEGGAAYSETDGTVSWNVSSAVLNRTDPVSMTVNYTANTTYTSGIGVLILAQSSGLCYRARYIPNTSEFEIDWTNTSGTTTSLQTATGITLATGSYLFTAAIYGLEISLYVQAVSTGEYLTPAGTYVAGKVAVIQVADVNITAATGSPGFSTQSGSGSTYPIGVTALSGGPLNFLPIDFGCPLVQDTFAIFQVLPAEGGLEPITYEIQQLIGGTWTGIGAITPNTQFQVSGLSPSTTYSGSFRCVATDSTSPTPQISTSPALTVTTTAALGYTPPTLTVPSSPYTTFQQAANYASFLDTTGNPIQIHTIEHTRDPYDGLWYSVGQLINATEGSGGECLHVKLYCSPDLMNFTPLGTVLSCASGTSSFPGGTAYTSMIRAKIRIHPTNGYRYLFVITGNNQGADPLWIFQSTSGSKGPYSYFAGPLTLPNGKDFGDHTEFIDYDGSATVFPSNAGTGNNTSCKLNSGWSAFNAATASPAPTFGSYEGLGVVRHDRCLYMACGPQVGFGWGAVGFQVFGGQMITQGVFLSNYTGTTLFTTATGAGGEALAAPVGAGPQNFAYGSGGAISSSQLDYTGGTATGVDASCGYATQCCALISLPWGGYIHCDDRHDTSGTENTATLLFPFTVSASTGLPQIPVSGNFVPQAGIYAFTGPSSGTVGTASSAFTIAPWAGIGDTVTATVTGGTGLSATSFTFTLASESPQTFTFTPPASGSYAITLSSSQGYPFAPASLTYTATEVGYTLAGPAHGVIGTMTVVGPIAHVIG